MIWKTTIVLFLIATPAVAEPPAVWTPMPVDYSEAASTRWLQKEVLKARPLDDMESLDQWVLHGKGNMSLTDERSKQGGHSVRLRFQTRTPEDTGADQNKRMFGVAGVMRRFSGEDWTEFNRVSFWIYPDFPGWRVAVVRIYLHNDGKIKVPGDFYPVYHCVVLKNQAWNQVVWEFPDLPRDRVVGLEVECRRQGNEPEAGSELSFDIDQLELQEVEPDHYEGWDVAKGRIAMSHSGYRPGFPKTAIASDLDSREFSLINKNTGERVLTKPVETVQTRIGPFQVMDFTEFRTPGTYTIQAGERTTPGFPIGDDIWTNSIWKAINFFHTERCGTDVPGSHRVCHRDWMVVHGDKKIVLNGGWHDAGDLSQGLVNTAESVYAMLDLAEKLRQRGENPALERALLDEASWGLDWVLKTRFGDGYRAGWATLGFWTDGIPGTNDDVTAEAQNKPFENFSAVTAEALAARVLKETDPDLAAGSLAAARKDWQFGVTEFAPVLAEADDSSKEKKDLSRLGIYTETASTGILASLELYRATHDQRYANYALQLAPSVLDSQQRTFPPNMEVPITGYYYTSPNKGRLLNYLHHTHEQAPTVAMVSLCDTFPDHPDWMKWYSSVVLFAEYYQKAMATLTKPYAMLPNSIRPANEYKAAALKDQEAMRQQIHNGFNVGGNYYVRAYPVQPQSNVRGNYGALLSQTKAVSTAARLRRDTQLERLAQEQLYWVVGRNPFAQSTMYGEGRDYTPLYSAMSGDIVGALPVGIMSRENFDRPYWPVHNRPTYREVWVHTVARWIWLMSDLTGPELAPETPSDAALDFRLEQTTHRDGQVTITLTAHGAGKHRFAVRTDNLTLNGEEKELTLSADPGETFTWKGQIITPDAPWIAVVVPDGALTGRKDITGMVP